MFSFGRVGTPYKGQQCGTRMGSNDTDRYRTLPHNAWFKLLHRWDPALSDNNSIGGLRDFLYANTTLKNLSICKRNSETHIRRCWDILVVPLLSEIFILVPIIPPSGEERDNIKYFRKSFLPFSLLFVQKGTVAGGREGYTEKMER